MTRLRPFPYSKKIEELFRCEISLGENAHQGLARQVFPVPRDSDPELGLGMVQEASVAACLVVNIETCPP